MKKGDRIMKGFRDNHSFISLGLAAAFVLLIAQSAFGQARKPQAPMTVKTGSISGTVFNAMGGRLAGVAVTVKDGKGKVVAEARTSAEGKYVLKGVGEGKYSVYLSGVKTANIKATRSARISSLKIVTPSGALKPAAKAAGTATRGGGGANRTNVRFHFIQLPTSYVIIGNDGSAPETGAQTHPHGNVSP